MHLPLASFWPRLRKLNNKHLLLSAAELGDDPPRQEILKSGRNLVSPLHGADEGWFAKRQTTAHNISSSIKPLSSRQGLDEVAYARGWHDCCAHPFYGRIGQRETDTGKASQRRGSAAKQLFASRAGALAFRVSPLQRPFWARLSGRADKKDPCHGQ
jgi:hypothetical protein